MVEIWAKSDTGQFNSADIRRTPEGIKVGQKVTDYEYMIGFWKFHPEASFLGGFVCLFSGLHGLQNQKIMAFAVFSLKTQKMP